MSEIEAHYEAKEVAAAASEVSAYFSAPTPRAAPDSEVATGFEGSEYGGEVVALFGGKVREGLRSTGCHVQVGRHPSIY